MATVGSIAQELRHMVGELDPDAVPLPQAMALWRRYDDIERLAASAKVLLARRVEEAGAWKRSGCRSAAEHLAKLSGTSIGAARGQLDTSRRLEALPRTAEAVRAGTLSSAQAEAVSAAAAVAPAAEARLLDTAEHSSLTELRDACLRAKAASDPDRETTHRRIHQKRSLREYTDGEGAWNLVARGTPEAGARIRAALDTLIDHTFDTNRAEGIREPREAYAFDALVALADQSRDGQAEATPKTRKQPHHLALLRIDLEALRRGEVHGDELCEITGLGPIPIRVARDLLGDSILKLVITKGTDVLHVTHLGRGPNAAQRVALLWQSPGCTNLGCPRTRTEIDHRTPWAETHHTRLGDLDPLCGHDHDLKTHHGWALVEGTGKRPLVPPHHPDHPRNAKSNGRDRDPP